MAYDVYPVEHLSPDVGLGRVGQFDPPISWETLIQRLKQDVEAPSVRVSGVIPEMIRKAAVCGGSGSSLIPEALLGRGAGFYLRRDRLSSHGFSTGTGIDSDGDRSLPIGKMGNTGLGRDFEKSESGG